MALFIFCHSQHFESGTRRRRRRRRRKQKNHVEMENYANRI
jgi:hypothetical protein